MKHLLRPSRYALGTCLGLCALAASEGAVAEVVDDGNRPEAPAQTDRGALEPGSAPGGFVPKRYPVDRYEKIWADSPFEFEIIVEEEEEEEVNPFEDLKLAGLHQSGQSYSVLIYDVKDPQAPRMRLDNEDFSDSGFRVDEVVRGNTYKDTEVIIVDREGRRGTITYDDKRLAARATGAVGAATRAPAGQRGQPNQPGQPNVQQQGQPNQQAQVNPTPQQVQAAQQNQQNRAEVIQRLLERARQNQQQGGRGRGGASNQQGGGQGAAGQERRRVVLPPTRR